MADNPHTPSLSPDEPRRGVRRTPAPDDARILEETPAPSETLTCPFCHSADVEPLSPFGAQLMTEQYYCRACRTPFERVRDDGGATEG